MHTPFTAPHNVKLLFKYLQGVVLVKPCTVNLSLETCKELFSQQFQALSSSLYKYLTSDLHPLLPRPAVLVPRHIQLHITEIRIYSQPSIFMARTAVEFLKVMALLLKNDPIPSFQFCFFLN